jgi:hypothetical protein
MKNIFFKPAVLLALLVAFSGCVKDDDFAIPTVYPVFFSEDFPEPEIDFNATFDFEGWTNFAEAGTKLWIERDFSNDGYIQFSSFGSGQASNIGWAITPSIEVPAGSVPFLRFRSASNFVDNNDNKLEVFVSTDYDGTNVLAATWTKLDAVVADKDSNPVDDYTYVESGAVSLAGYSGTIHIAFKATGSNTLDGLFQVDSVRVYSLK